jgi:nitrate reductase alpha subunit
MARLTDRLHFFRREDQRFADGHGRTTGEDRSWEEFYRNRWQHDKVVRSTHGVNCTGSCSWKIYVKGGIVTWETQQTDYPETKPELPNYEPRGCPRGASFSWYLYSGNRLKYPLVRSRLVRLWREARQTLSPVEAWRSIVEDSERARAYKEIRGRGGFVRARWEEVNEIIAAANVYTTRRYGPDRIAGFSPIPAMSMVSYAAGTRYLSLIGGNCMSFYDWYCDLPPSSPQTWGEQTDVPESADWYNARFLLLWGSNVPQTRTPDAHFYAEARYNGTQSAVVSPDYSEASKFADIWLAPTQGTDSAVALAMGHVIMSEFHIRRQSPYFRDYCRRFTDMPMLVRLKRQGDYYVPERQLRASDFPDALGHDTHPDWKTVAWDRASGRPVSPQGAIGYRWENAGNWNLEQKDGATGEEIDPALSALEAAGGSQAADASSAHAAEVVTVGFPYYGDRNHDYFTGTDHPSVLQRPVPALRVETAEGEELVTTVFDLLAGNYGVDRGLEGAAADAVEAATTSTTAATADTAAAAGVAGAYDDDVPYTPAWQERITGVERSKVIAVAREFASVAEKTEGSSMVILGAGINHWYNMDMTYRAIINMLVMCGCVGKAGGGWAHYVGQEKVRPISGWATLAFALDWHRPPRHMNSTSFFYVHSDQWRYEKLSTADHISPTAEAGNWDRPSMDYNVASARMGWLPTAPHFDRNPLELTREAEEAGKEPKEYITEELKAGRLRFAFEDPDAEQNSPKNLFVWRSNLLGSSGKGHEYMLKYLCGAQHGVLGEELDPERDAEVMPQEVEWREKAPEGKLDLMVTLDFRMSTTCLYSDIVLPTATWYEKNDLSTTDLHTYIHPFTSAVDPMWEARSDWDIFRGVARRFSELAEDTLGTRKDVVAAPIQHDTPAELGQATEVRDWKKGECEPVPGSTMPNLAVIEREYPETYRKFSSLGTLLDRAGVAAKGVSWDATPEVEYLSRINRVHREEGAWKDRPKIESAINAAETIMTLAPETNGSVALRAWQSMGTRTGRDHSHLARAHEGEHIRFHHIVGQPRKTLTSPTWSGREDEETTYNAMYTNTHELIPWRTLSGRQHLYQDHPWMRAFGESLAVYKPPVNTHSVTQMMQQDENGNREIVLNFLTPHQKWGIHSTFSDNLIMLTLARGGPIIWMSEDDARQAGIEDNDWIEVFNANGSLVARAVVSQRVKPGMVMMYHAQERIVNVPGSEITGQRGGIHNSVTRTVMKPTHMIGGYAQQSYFFNYYGTVGSNRDEFVVIRKMNTIDWVEGSAEADRRDGAAQRGNAR